MKLKYLYEYKLLKPDIERLALIITDWIVAYISKNKHILKSNKKHEVLIWSEILRGKGVKFYLTNDNRHSAYPSTASIFISYIDGYTYDDYLEVVEHELIHVFDPKLSPQNVLLRIKAWNRVYSPKEIKKYYKSPSELDAYIPTLAKKYVKGLFRILDYDEKSVRKAINRSVYDQYSDAALKVWVYDKSLWKKYLKAIVHYFQFYTNLYKDKSIVNYHRLGNKLI